MSRDAEVYDSFLLGILQKEGNIGSFLDVINGFLLRKTDFFIVRENEGGKIGFPAGDALRIVQHSFGKFQTHAARRDAAIAASRRKAVEEKEKQKKQSMSASKEDAPTTAMKTVDPLRGEGDQAAAAASDKGAGAAAGPSSAELPSKTPQPSGQSDPPSEQSSPADQAPTPKSSDAPDSTASKEGDAAAESKAKDQDRRGEEEEEEEDPQKAAERRALQANPETYNGADRGSYRWAQSITEVDVYVKVPERIQKGKLVQVTSERKHLKVAILGADGQWQVLVDGELTWEVKNDDYWTLSPGKHVHIPMEKKEERWWEALLVGEPKINTRKIDCSRPITDLDDEAQAKIDELMYNQRAKEQGLPQSHEKKTYKILQDAWNAPGSPFAGRPFDPSLVSVDQSGVVTMK